MTSQINRWTEHFAIGVFVRLFVQLLVLGCASGTLTLSFRGADAPACYPDN
jgi:hypothetical protein